MFRDEEHRQVGDFGRFAEASGRYLFAELRLVDVGGHVRAHESRGDGIHRHPLFGHLLRQRLGRGDHAALGRGVIGLPGQPLDARERDDVDDAPEPVHEHPLEQRPRDVVEPVEAGADHRVPLLRFHPHHQHVVADARVVHHHLDAGAFVRFLPCLDGRRALFARGHVELQCLAVAACGADARQGFFGLGGVRLGVDEHVVAAPAQFAADFAAYAPAAAGHECVFIRFCHFLRL